MFHIGHCSEKDEFPCAHSKLCMLYYFTINFTCFGKWQYEAVPCATVFRIGYPLTCELLQFTNRAVRHHTFISLSSFIRNMLKTDSLQEVAQFSHMQKFIFLSSKHIRAICLRLECDRVGRFHDFSLLFLRSGSRRIGKCRHRLRDTVYRTQ